MQKRKRSLPRLRNVRIHWPQGGPHRIQPVAGRLGSNSQRRVQPRGISLRAGLAVVGGRAAVALSRRLHLGGGTSIAGIVAQRLYPEITSYLAAELEHGSVMVTGTNGKTTSSGFIAAILR